MVDAFLLSIDSDMNGLKINYDIVRDFSVKWELDKLDTFGLFKRMLTELRE